MPGLPPSSTASASSTPDHPVAPRPEWRTILFGHPAYWVCQFIGWFGSAVGENMVSMLHSSRTMLEVGFTLVGACFGIALSHLLRGVIWWRQWFTLSWPRQLLCYLLVCLPAAALYTVLFLPLVWHVDPYEIVPEQRFRVMLDTLYMTYSALLVWCGFYFGWHYFRNYQKMMLDRASLDIALKEAELRALRGQLNPHFLFNALNSIRALIGEHPGRARDAVTLLANLLRGSLHSSEHKLIPLFRELEAVESYLALESIRLEDRLCVTTSVDPALRETPVPPLCLQTLVENAVKHGISPSLDGGKIEITIAREGGNLLLSVINTPGRIDPGKRIVGVGLRNLRGRVHLLFAGAATLELHQADSDRVAARLRMPLAHGMHDRHDA